MHADAQLYTAQYRAVMLQAAQEQVALGMYGRSQSATALASPFAAAVDLAQSVHLSTLPNAPGVGTTNALPPKHRGIDRRSATELLPSIYSGVPLCFLRDSRPNVLAAHMVRVDIEPALTWNGLHA